MAFFRNSFNVWFASDVTVTLEHHGVNDIEVHLTDRKHIRELKTIIRGFERNDSGISCGFAPDYSITFSNNVKSVTVYLPMDGCSNIGLDFSGRYVRISERSRKRMGAILAEYGFVPNLISNQTRDISI